MRQATVFRELNARTSQFHSPPSRFASPIGARSPTSGKRARRTRSLRRAHDDARRTPGRRRRQLATSAVPAASISAFAGAWWTGSMSRRAHFLASPALGGPFRCLPICRVYAGTYPRRTPSGQPPAHGLLGYRNYGCRCNVCHEANEAIPRTNAEARQPWSHGGAVTGYRKYAGFGAAVGRGRVAAGPERAAAR